MNRQITFFRYEVGVQEMEQAEDGRYDLVRHPVAEVEATHLTKTDIRRIVTEEGVPCPRGTDVYADKLCKIRYRFTSEDLMAIAKEREVMPL